MDKTKLREKMVEILSEVTDAEAAEVLEEIRKTFEKRTRNSSSQWEILKNIVNKTIDSEFEHIQDRNLEDMTSLSEHKDLSKEINEAYKKLCSLLPNEHHGLVEQLEVKTVELMCLEIRHYFKKGVIAGLTNLKYLEEIGEEIVII